MAGIKKQPNGKYRATVDCGYDHNGKRIRKSKTCDTKKEAATWQAEMRLNSNRIDLANVDITFSNLAEKWLQSKRERKITNGTLCKYENIMRVVREYPRPFYKQKAKQIKKADVESLLNYLAFEKSLSLNYIAKDIRTILSAIFTFGVDNDMLFKNPCKNADLPNIAATKSTKDSFTPEEIKAIEDHHENIPFGDIVFTLISTGMRAQEICAITDKSFFRDDAGQWFIKVNAAMKRSRTGGWERGAVKTAKSERDIPISGTIYSKLMARVMSNQDHFLLPGREPGREVSYTNFKAHYDLFFDTLNAVSGVNIRKLPPHCCRHTFNSRLIWEGVSPFVIQSLMGHTNSDMTDNYAHIMQEQKVEAVKKISVV